MTSHLLYPSRINNIMGESGGGKSWLALLAAKQEILAKNHVMWIDYEDSPRGLAARFKEVGVTQQQMIDQLAYIQPSRRWNAMALEQITAMTQQRPLTLCVIDSVGEALSMEGIRPNEDDEVGRWFTFMLRPLERLGLTVLLIDHIPKASGEGGPSNFAIGSQRKRAAIDGASYRLDQVVPFARGVAGKSALYVAKDRWGAHPLGMHVADMHVSPGVTEAATGQTRTTIRLVKVGAMSDPTRKPTLMARVSRYVEERGSGDPPSMGEIEQDMGGKAATVRDAVRHLVEGGFIQRDRAGRGVKSTISFIKRFDVNESQLDSLATGVDELDRMGRPGASDRVVSRLLERLPEVPDEAPFEAGRTAPKSEAVGESSRAEVRPDELPAQGSSSQFVPVRPDEAKPSSSVRPTPYRWDELGTKARDEGIPEAVRRAVPGMFGPIEEEPATDPTEESY